MSRIEFDDFAVQTDAEDNIHTDDDDLVITDWWNYRPIVRPYTSLLVMSNYVWTVTTKDIADSAGVYYERIAHDAIADSGVAHGTKVQRIKMGVGKAGEFGDVTAHTMLSASVGDNASYSLNLTGHNGDFGTTPETLWDGPGDWEPPATPQPYVASSTSAADTFPLAIEGNDEHGDRILELVTLAGTTPVATTNDFRSVWRISNAGTADNAGAVTVAAQNDGTVGAYMLAGANVSHQATFEVPTDYIALVSDYWLQYEGSHQNDYLTAVMQIRNPGAVWIGRGITGMSPEDPSNMRYIYQAYSAYGPGTQIRLQVYGARAGNTAYGGIGLACINE